MFPPAGRLRSSIRATLHGSDAMRDPQRAPHPAVSGAGVGAVTTLSGWHAARHCAPPAPTLGDSAAGSHALPAASVRRCPDASERELFEQRLGGGDSGGAADPAREDFKILGAQDPLMLRCRNGKASRL